MGLPPSTEDGSAAADAAAGSPISHNQVALFGAGSATQSFAVTTQASGGAVRNVVKELKGYCNSLLDDGQDRPTDAEHKKQYDFLMRLIKILQSSSNPRRFQVVLGLLYAQAFEGADEIDVKRAGLERTKAFEKKRRGRVDFGWYYIISGGLIQFVVKDFGQSFADSLFDMGKGFKNLGPFTDDSQDSRGFVALLKFAATWLHVADTSIFDNSRFCSETTAVEAQAKALPLIRNLRSRLPEIPVCGQERQIQAAYERLLQEGEGADAPQALVSHESSAVALPSQWMKIELELCRDCQGLPLDEKRCRWEAKAADILRRSPRTITEDLTEIKALARAMLLVLARTHADAKTTEEKQIAACAAEKLGDCYAHSQESASDFIAANVYLLAAPQPHCVREAINIFVKHWNAHELRALRPQVIELLKCYAHVRDSEIAFRSVAVVARQQLSRIYFHASEVGERGVPSENLILAIRYGLAADRIDMGLETHEREQTAAILAERIKYLANVAAESRCTDVSSVVSFVLRLQGSQSTGKTVWQTIVSRTENPFSHERQQALAQLPGTRLDPLLLGSVYAFFHRFRHRSDLLHRDIPDFIAAKLDGITDAEVSRFLAMDSEPGAGAVEASSFDYQFVNEWRQSIVDHNQDATLSGFLGELSPEQVQECVRVYRFMEMYQALGGRLSSAVVAPGSEKPELYTEAVDACYRAVLAAEAPATYAPGRN